jgi:hypothetical protein
MDIDKQTTQTQYLIGDDVLFKPTRFATLHTEIEDIRYSGLYGVWYYEIPQNLGYEISFLMLDRDSYPKILKSDVACPSCNARGVREKQKLRCTNDGCNTRLFDGVTYSFGTKTVTAPSISTSENPDETNKLEDIVYSLSDDEWYYKYTDFRRAVVSSDN